MVIEGGMPHGAEIETYNDHRIAMSFAMLGLVVRGIRIRDRACVRKSFPGFWKRWGGCTIGHEHRIDRIPGVGKDRRGKRLSKLLGLSFYDTDDLIRERTGKSSGRSSAKGGGRHSGRPRKLSSPGSPVWKGRSSPWAAAPSPSGRMLRS